MEHHIYIFIPNYIIDKIHIGLIQLLFLDVLGLEGLLDFSLGFFLANNEKAVYI